MRREEKRSGVSFMEGREEILDWREKFLYTYQVSLS